jgi:hypothetical protein
MSYIPIAFRVFPLLRGKIGLFETKKALQLVVEGPLTHYE